MSDQPKAVVTEAHSALVGKVRGMVVDYKAFDLSYVAAAQLIADSEYAERFVADLKVERDQLQVDAASMAVRLNEAITERDALRAEVERLTREKRIEQMTAEHLAVRVDKAEAELAKERARHAGIVPLLARWLKMADDCHHEQQEVGHSEYNVTVGLVCDTRTAIDAAMKEDTK